MTVLVVQSTITKSRDIRIPIGLEDTYFRAYPLPEFDVILTIPNCDDRTLVPEFDEIPISAFPSARVERESAKRSSRHRQGDL